jgi:hypothetical protein
MGLLNIQGQVQGIAIGLLLILSILLPNTIRQISAGGARLTFKNILVVLAAGLVFALFLAFFFASRAPIIAGG